MPVTTILDPTADSSAVPGSIAQRPMSLNGLRVGLLHNSKPGGDILLRTVGGRLSNDYTLKSVIWRSKLRPSVPADFLHEMKDQCDVVVVALAD